MINLFMPFSMYDSIVEALDQLPDIFLLLGDE